MTFWSRVAGWFTGWRSPAADANDPSPGAPRPATPTPEAAFTALAEELLSDMPEIESLRRNPGDFSLTVEHDGVEHVVFLGNVFRETRELPPDERRERVRDFVQLVGKMRDDTVPWEEARERLVPLVRPATIYANVTMAEGSALVRRPFLPFLVEAVGLDSERSMQLLTTSSVREWGVDLSELYAAARSLLASCVTEIGPYDPTSPFPLWHVTTDDSYESSRLLLPGWLASFAEKVNGRPVAIVPHRTLLVVGGDRDEECVRRLLDIAKHEYEAATRPISPALYTVDDAGTVIPFTLPEGHPLKNGVDLSHLVLANVEYDAQREPLQTAVGDETYVATFTAIRRDDGSVTSYAVWTPEIPTLLPRTEELVLIVDPEKRDHLRVPWSAVERLAPGCLVPEPDLNPQRYRTARWPAPGEVGALREAARR
jgi:hypothetical protein